MTNNKADDHITRHMAVPAWMVYGSMSLIVVLAGGPVGQVVMLSHHVYEIQDRIGMSERELAAIRVKQDDIVHALRDVTTELQVLTKSVVVLNSKMN